MKSGSTPAVPVSIVVGVHLDRVAAVVDGLIARADRLAVLAYAATPDVGLVCRVRDSDGRYAEQSLPPQEQHCVSCAMLSDAAGMLRLLARSGRYDAIVLQLAGGWELEVAAGCLGGTGPDGPLRDAARVDTLVAVLDAPSVYTDLSGPQLLTDRGIAMAAHDHRSLAPVLAQQIEAADTLVLLDAAGPNHPGPALVERLAPEARTVCPAGPYDVPLDAVLATGRFDRRRISVFADRGPLDPDRPATVERDGVGTVRFEGRRPLHPARLRETLHRLTAEAVRGSGRLWLATRPDVVVRFELAGTTVSLNPVGRWLDSPDAPAEEDQRRTARRTWDPYYGDRAQHLAFTGPGLDPDRILATLEPCLLTDEELALGPEVWRTLPDPITAGGHRRPGETTDPRLSTDPDEDAAP